MYFDVNTFFDDDPIITKKEEKRRWKESIKLPPIRLKPLEVSKKEDEDQIKDIVLPEPVVLPQKTWQPLEDKVYVKQLFAQHYPTLTTETMTLKELVIWQSEKFMEEIKALKERVQKLEDENHKLRTQVVVSSEQVISEVTLSTPKVKKAKTKKKKKDYTIMDLKPEEVLIEEKPEIVLPAFVPKKTEKTEPEEEYDPDADLFKIRWPERIPVYLRKKYKDANIFLKKGICMNIYNKIHNKFLKDHIIDPQAVREMRNHIYTKPIYDVWTELNDYMNYWKNAVETGEAKCFEEKYRVVQANKAVKSLDQNKPSASYTKKSKLSK